MRSLNYGTFPDGFAEACPTSYPIRHGSPQGAGAPPAGDYTPAELEAEVRRLITLYEDGDDEAGSWASDILSTLGFEWI